MIKKIFIYSLAVFFISTANAETIVTESTTNSKIITEGNMETTVKSPPPSAISPQFSSGSNSDLCTIGVAGAVQTQILGISAGTTFTEENCIRLKNAKTLYDMGMKVAAVSMLCQDPNTFYAMKMAGTPCPYEGKIGKEAEIAWKAHEEPPIKPTSDKELEVEDKAFMGLGGMLGWLLFL